MPFNGNKFLEVKDCIFVKGLRTNSSIKISNLRDFFQERVGECSVQTIIHSKDKKWIFVALKFKSAAIAEDVMERFNGKHILGHRMTLNYWRVPRNKVPSGWPLDENHSTPHNRNSRWENGNHAKNNTEMAARNDTEYSRDRSSQNRNPSPRDVVHYNGKENFSDDTDIITDYQDHSFAGRYDTSENLSYEEKETEEYWWEHWDSDGAEGGYHGENRSDWDSDYNGGSENLSEREYYEREEELSYHHNDDIWTDNEDDSDHAFTDETDARDVETTCSYPELNISREFYREPYQGSLREEHVHSQYNDYSKRPSQERGYRTEDTCQRNRDWHTEKEYDSIEGHQGRSQGDIPNRFSSFDQTDHRPQWEVVAPSNLTRRRLSDPDALHNTPNHFSREQGLADQRSCDKGRDFSGRKAGSVPSVPEERPRSDEWVRVRQKNFSDERQGRRSSSPVNLWSKAFGHQGSPRNRSSEAFDNRTSLGRTHGDNSVSSFRGRRSISPLRTKRSSVINSKRSSSSERNSGYTRRYTPPHSERLSRSCNVQSSSTRQSDSHSFATRGRHNDKIQHDKGIQRTSSKKHCDLRRSLMLHQQRKHLSSLPRSRAREEGKRHSSLEEEKKTSSDEHDKSFSSHSSSESGSPPKGVNRKRPHVNDKKAKKDAETAKKRKQQGHSTLNHDSVTANGKSESTRNKRDKKICESKRHSPQDQKKPTQESRGQVSGKSNTKRADRLLSDLAVTLAGNNIPLRRPVASEEGASNDLNSVAPKSAENVRRRAERSHGYSSPTKGSHSNKGLQSVGADEGVTSSKETESSGHTVEEASEGKVTSHDNSTTRLAVSCFGDNSVQDGNKPGKAYDNTDLSADNSYNADTGLSPGKGSASPKVKLEACNLSSEDHDFTTIDKNATFIVDDFEKTAKLELNENTASTKTSELASVGQLGQANSKTEISHVVDMEFSSDDTSPGVVQSSKTFCYAGNLNYKGNETINTRVNENDIKKASHCVTADKMEIKTSEVGNIKLNNTGSHLLYTEQSIYGTEVSESSRGALKLGGCIMVERSYGSSPKRIVPPVKKEKSEDICTEQELSNSRSYGAAVDPGKGKQENDKTQNGERSNEAYVVKRYDFSPRDINDREHATVNVYNRMQIVNKLDDALCDASYKEKKILHTEESHAEFTQGKFGHDTKDSHVYSLKLEGCDMKEAKMYTSNKAEVNNVESIDGTEKQVYNGDGISSAYQDKEEAHGTEQEVKDVSVFNDIKKGICNKAEGKNDKYAKNEGQSEESAKSDDNEHREIIYGVNIKDCLHKEDSEDSNNKGNTKSKSENGRIDAFDPGQDVCGKKRENVTSCVDKAFQEKRIGGGKDQKCDKEELIFYNTESDCVTQKGLSSPSQKRMEVNGYVTQQKHSSQQLRVGSNANKDSHATDNKALNMSSARGKGLNAELCNLNDAYASKEELCKTAVFSNVVNKQHERLNTKAPSLDVKLQEKVDDSKTGEANLGVTETSCSSFVSTVPYQSNTVATHSPQVPSGANISSALSPNTCPSDQSAQASHRLVPENFDNMDMEIFSDEEHHQQSSSNSIVRAGDDNNTRYKDASTPYSPSSPTWKSDEQSSPPPPPKDDSSPYSPSHPTNVSEGDIEHNDPVKELCYDDNENERVADACETRKEKTNADQFENSFEASKVEKNDSAPNITALNHVINTDGLGVNTVSYPRDFSSPKPNSGSPQRVSPAKDFVDVNTSADELAQYGRKTTNNECDKYVGSSSTVCSDNFTGGDSAKDTRRPVMRFPRRTQSVPTLTSIAPKPEVVYITATKKKHVRGENGSQSKLQILYITEDKTVPKSPSLNESPRKQRLFAATPTRDCRSTERRTVLETEQHKVEKRVRDVGPLLTERSCESDAILKPGHKDTRDVNNDTRHDNNDTRHGDNDTGDGDNDTGDGDNDTRHDNDSRHDNDTRHGDNDTRHGDNEGGSRGNTEVKVDMALRTATTTDIAVSAADIGSGVFAVNGVTDKTSSIGKQKAAFSNAREQQDSVGKPLLKDKTISFLSATPLARDTLFKDSIADNEAVNFLSNKHDNESEDLRVLPTSLTKVSDVVTEIRSTNVDKDVSKAINKNNNGKLYNGILCNTVTSTGDEDHISLGSVTKNNTLVSQAPLKIREKESQYRYTVTTTYHARGQMTELPSNCNFSPGRSVKDVNGDNSCGPVQIEMKPGVAGKRTSTALQVTALGNGSSQTLLSENDACSEDKVQEENVTNKKRELDKQMLTSVSSRFANKRPHTTTSNEASHPCKVPRKALKLVMPNRDGKMAVKPGKKVATKTSSCTITSSDLDVAPGSNGLRANEMVNTGIIDDMLVEAPRNVNGKEMVTFLSSPTSKTNKASNRGSTGSPKHARKTASCTVTRVDLDFVPGSNGVIDGKNAGMETFKDNSSVSVDSELLTVLSPRSSNTKQAEGKGLCQGDDLGPVTGNMSPLSAHFAGYNQHDRHSLASVEDANMVEQRAKGGKASFVGKESEWTACKMERLRKKKEEIEQVYKRECQTVISVVKMLVSKDPRLEGVLQNAVRRSLQEMGQRCVQELEKEARPAT